MSRFYVKPDNVKGDKIFISGDETHHILRVMRLKKDDKITAFDGTGREYHGFIERASKNSAVVKVKDTSIPKSGKGYAVTLAQAIPKMDKMDYIIQKAVELGVDSVIPMETNRTIVRLSGERAASRLKRWQRIAEEASKQCGRVDIAQIEGVRNFKEVLKACDRYGLALMPSVYSRKKKGLKRILSDFRGKEIILFIGPEGGFDADEHREALKKGVLCVSLGDNVLRCDTAAVASLAMLKFSLSEI